MSEKRINLNEEVPNVKVEVVSKKRLKFIIIFPAQMSTAKKECPSCAMDIARTCKVCPVCDYEFPVESKLKPWIIILLVLVIFLLAIGGRKWL
ncbi:MAG: hypothetical protein M3R17_12010 [Bacteroidota bacterium]|nr:hypothetical protein [Bacteroidota bacterium]